jgi:type II restriction enzyme
MNLCFDTGKAAGYKSPSQIARVLTESWAASNLYCVSCRSNRLEPASDNTRVIDFICENCYEKYQLKSQSKPLRKKVVDAAYEPMMDAIEENKAPNFLLMHYLKNEYCVNDLLVIPRYFVTPSCIEPRNPLGPKARRAGWVGCNILLSELPEDGRIPLILSGSILPRGQARKNYERFRFLADKDSDVRGWTADVLKVVRDIGKKEFTLKEVYAYEDYLGKLHPKNTRVRPKIRQQLQLLRDRGILLFTSPGRYAIGGGASSSPRGR